MTNFHPINLNDRQKSVIEPTLEQINMAQTKVPCLSIASDKEISIVGVFLYVDDVAINLAEETLGSVVVKLVDNGVDCKLMNANLAMIPAKLLSDFSNRIYRTQSIYSSPTTLSLNLGSAINNIYSIGNDAVEVEIIRVMNDNTKDSVSHHLVNSNLYCALTGFEIQAFYKIKLKKFILWYQDTKIINTVDVLNTPSGAIKNIVLEKVNTLNKS